MKKDFLSTRFGIEIEFTGITRADAALVLQHNIGSRNCRHVNSYDARTVTGPDGRKWKIVRDGSIRMQTYRNGALRWTTSQEYKVEFVSPILTYRSDIELLQKIIRDFRKLGAVVNDTCGIHIHLDGVDHTAKSIRNFINIVASHNDLLYKALNVKIKRMNYCKKLDEKFVKEIAKQRPKTMQQIEDIWYSGQSGSRYEHYNDTKYHFLNLHSFFHGHGTVELRGFNSTLHAGVVRSYIVLALALNHQALNAKSVRKDKSKVQDDNPKFAMRTYLNRLGLIGDEFKACRKHLVKFLDGNAAWRSGTAGVLSA